MLAGRKSDVAVVNLATASYSIKVLRTAIPPPGAAYSYCALPVWQAS